MKDTAAVITISDKGVRGERVDTSGPALCAMLEEDGWQIIHRAMLPDEREKIQEELKYCADVLKVQLVLTTGGTGFSQRDVTPEATREILDRDIPGIPEAMRAESMRITPRACLSRSAAGTRKETLIINLPGSEKASTENLRAVLPALHHGVLMLQSKGSADCGQPVQPTKQRAPSMDRWLREAKADPQAKQCGMYLFHNGVVRETAKAQVRQHLDAPAVKALKFSYDAEKLEAAISRAKNMEGIFHVRVWLNRGTLQVGDDMMQVLVGGDIRPHVVDCLQSLVEEIKTSCVKEEEKY